VAVESQRAFARPGRQGFPSKLGATRPWLRPRYGWRASIGSRWLPWSTWSDTHPRSSRPWPLGTAPQGAVV